MQIPPPTRLAARRGDAGQASMFVLLGLAFSMLAVMLLFVRLGNANDLRSQAQTAADAAALAAVGDTQQRVIDALVSGSIMYYSSWNPATGEAAAEEYARENHAVITDLRASDNIYGFSGNHVRVTVRGAQCQRELEENRTRDWADTPCRGNEDEEDIPTFSGTAEAIARIDVPTCSPVNGEFDAPRVQCGGKVIYNERDARSVVDVQLVDQEGTYLWETGGGSLPDGPPPIGDHSRRNCDAPYAGQVTELMCQTHKAVLAEFPYYNRPTWTGCYRPDGGVVVGEHPKGRACDYMVSPIGKMPTGEQEALGDATAAWMQQNHEALGVMYIIWKQHIWSPSRASEGWRSMNDRGSVTQNHHDHVHLSVL